MVIRRFINFPFAYSLLMTSHIYCSNMETFGRLDLIGEKAHPRIDPTPSYKLLPTMVIHIDIKSHIHCMIRR